MIRRAGARAAAVALVAAAVVLSGCRVGSEVGIDVRRDGSGTVAVEVALDADAAGRLGDPASIALDDLRQVGWDVPAPVAEATGVRVVATRRFRSPEQLPALLAEVGGTDGVFRGVRLEVDPDPTRTRYTFRARVVLSGQVAELSDDALTGVLGGLPLGRTPEELVALGADDPGTVTLRVRVTLPGRPTTTNGDRDGRTVAWSFPVSGGEATDAPLRARSEVVNRGTVQALTVAAALAGVALLVLLVGLARRRWVRPRS